MAEYLIQDTTLDAIADAINAKLDTSVAMTPAEMVAAIESISGGGGGLEHHQFIHAEDWLTDATGNANAFYNAYLSQLYANKSNGYAFAVITNNATQYAARFTFRNFELINETCWMRSNSISTCRIDIGGSGGSISFYISAGSIIDVYIVQDEST